MEVFGSGFLLGGSVGVLDGAAELVGLALGEDEGDLLGAFVVGVIVGEDEGDLVGDSVPVLVVLVSIELTLTSTSPSLNESV